MAKKPGVLIARSSAEDRKPAAADAISGREPGFPRMPPSSQKRREEYDDG